MVKGMIIINEDIDIKPLIKREHKGEKSITIKRGRWVGKDWDKNFCTRD